MRTNLATSEVETGEITARASFSIKANSKAFNILSDGLYSDKPKAVIRELCCNAYDAHVAAGRKDAPFEVHLPNAMEPWFSVKDFGTGLSDEDVMHLYTTYFESTKTTSNDFIGALGLGSKSPFSYVDAFTVTSRHDGMLRTYTAFIDNTGPAIVKMSEEETDEPNGLEVSMPVEQADFHIFKARAEEVLKRFKPLPIIDAQLNPPTYTIEGTGWAVRKHDGHGMVAIQGNVAYPINSGPLSGKLTSTQQSAFGLSIDVFFDIGDLEVAASREALQYDERTIANIKARLDTVVAEIPTKFQSYFANTMTLWEALMTYQELTAGLDYRLVGLLDSKMLWNGRKVSDRYLEIDAKGLKPETSILEASHSYRRKHLFLEEDRNVKFSASSNHQFFWDDRTETYKVKQRIEEAAGRIRDIIVFRTPHADDFNVLWEQAGKPPYKRVADLPAIPKPPPRPRSKTSNLKKLYSLNDVGDWVETTHDVSTGGVFVHLHKFEATWNGHTFHSFNSIVQAVKQLGAYDGPIFGIPATFKTVPNKHKGWTEFFGHVTPGLKQLLKQKKLLQGIANMRELGRHNSSWAFSFLEELEKKGWKPKRANSPFGKFIVQVAKLRANAVNDSITHVLNRLDINYTMPEPILKLDPVIEGLGEAYPLLAEESYFYEREVPEYLIYLNAKDASK